MNLNNGKFNDFDVDYIKIAQHIKNTVFFKKLLFQSPASNCHILMSGSV